MSSKSPSKAGPANRAPSETEEELLADAAVAREEGRSARFDGRAAIRSVRNIANLLRLDAAAIARLADDERKFTIAVKADLAEASIDHAFVAPAVAIAERLATLLDGPRPGTIYTAEQKATINRIAKKVSRAKAAVGPMARKKRLPDAADRFGRGATFDHDNPSEVLGALSLFLEGARAFPELVAKVPMTPADLDAFAGDKAALEAMLQHKPIRTGARTAGTDAVKVEELALDGWFDSYRSRATWKLEDDAARSRVLGLLPRAPERRKPAAEAPAVKPPDGAETPAK